MGLQLILPQLKVTWTAHQKVSKKNSTCYVFLRPECQDADVHILIILNFWYIELGPHYKCAH